MVRQLESYLKYNKSKLNEAYLYEKMKLAILDGMEGINFYKNEKIVDNSRNCD